MNETLFNIILIFVFILIGGVRCRGDGIAVTSPSQVKRLVRRRRRGAAGGQVARELARIGPEWEVWAVSSSGLRGDDGVVLGDRGRKGHHRVTSRLVARSRSRK